MSASMSKCIGGFMSRKNDQDSILTQKQGIVTILTPDSEKNRASPVSLRRTLSADLSSKKRLSQNGFPPMKRIASHDQLSVLFSVYSSPSFQGGEECEERKELGAEGGGQFDIWSSVMSQKTQEESSKLISQPYVPPIVKKLQRSLNEKSFEICTESLGSETGSDGFSSYPPSETGETEEDKEEETEEMITAIETYDSDEYQNVAKCKYSYASGKNFQARLFPPPLASLSHQDGESLQMRTYRDRGRLILEAVSIPSQNNFRAERQDGRLVLSFYGHPGDEQPAKKDEEEVVEDEVEELGEEFSEDEVDDEEDREHEEDDNDALEDGKEDGNESGDEGENVEIVIEKGPKFPIGVTNVHRSALMVNKPINIIANRNPKWSKKLNEVVQFEGREEGIEVGQSLPARVSSGLVTGGGGAASFNAYEYYWRTKPKAKATLILDPLVQNKPDKNTTNTKLLVSKDVNLANNHQKLLVLRGNKGDYLVPMVKSCKESRRSFLFWEPRCIATS